MEEKLLQLPLNEADALEDLAERIRKQGGEISYQLPDYHSLLNVLRIGVDQQNLAFAALDALRRSQRLKRRTDKVFPARTYDVGSRSGVHVRRVVYSLA